MLCRTSSDCDWLDKDLFCQQMSVSVSPGWFGENTEPIEGKCQCPYWKVWDNNSLNCKEPLSTEMIILYVLIGITISGIILYELQPWR